MPALSFLAPWIVIATLVGVALGRYPWLRMNRATMALAGAAALALTGGLTLEEAYSALDLDTIVLLFSMMILNANFRLSGFFRLAGRWVARSARTPRMLLAFIIAVSGGLSALFLNDTIVLMFTPLVLEVVESLRRNPIPYLVGLVAAANLGSVAAITGNPQNMIIGVASGIRFTAFSKALGPVALVGLFLAWMVLVLVYRTEFKKATFEFRPEVRVRPLKPVLRKSLVAAGLMLLAFLGGAPVPLAALGAAVLLLVTRRLKPERVFREVDFSLLVFFASLFIVTGAMEPAGLSGKLFEWFLPVAQTGLPALAGVAVLLSNLVSNVPAVLLFRPLVPGFPDPQQAWLTLAMATTLAGNLTLLGSVANLIVAENARERGVNLTFSEYLKAGVPITLVTFLFGLFWLMF